MSKTIVMFVTTKLVIQADDSLSANELFSDMDYSFDITEVGAEVVDTELVDFEVKAVV